MRSHDYPLEEQDAPSPKRKLGRKRSYSAWIDVRYMPWKARLMNSVMIGGIKQFGIGLLFLMGNVFLSGCESKSCTNMACFDGMNLTVRTMSGDFPPGNHTITIDADGNTLSCSFEYPPATSSIQCTSGLSVTILPMESCVEEKRREATTYTCTPIPNQYQERIFVNGTPKWISMVQSVDGVSILERVVTPTYITTEPNGNGCGKCTQGSFNLDIP